MLEAERRLLVLTPTGRDAALTRAVLASLHVPCAPVEVARLREEVEAGAGAILVAEEAIANGAGAVLSEALASQPAWSDLPLIVLTGTGADSPAVSRALKMLGNVSLLERPVRIAALVAAVKTALRARERQYLLRAHLLERERVETALRESEQQVRAQVAQVKEADRRKDEFLATLAHELRNPLAPICNALHVIRLAGDDPEKTRRMLAVLEHQVGYMVRLVDDLLELSRITRGRIELRREMVDLSTLVERALETSRPHLEAARHRLTVRLPKRPLVVNGDPVRLAQVFANLINNAAKYTKEGGDIGVSAERRAGDAVVSVRDTGVGIPREMLSRIFDMFTQVNPRAPGGSQGLGIGLTLARTLVEMHGGRIEAASAGSGEGSEFVVSLPLALGAVVPSPTSEPRPRSGLHGMRVLVTDDHPETADGLALILEMLGAEVRTARSGEEALEIVESFLPSVALLDIGMPGMDGYETARRLRKRRGDHRVTLIALTGWGQSDDRRRSKDAGFDHHLIKPPDLDTLVDLLESLAEPQRV